MIDQATIDRIMDAAQITDVVSDFVTLRKRGVNYVGLCPFHDDKTPSFYVSPSKGLCKCFACGKGGNAVHFIMEHEQLTYPEALRYLARKYGIEIKERELSNEEKQAQSERESLFVVNLFARDYFQNILHNHVDGRSIGMAYFHSRGFRDDIIEKFQLGYCTDSHDAFAQEALKKGYKKEIHCRYANVLGLWTDVYITTIKTPEEAYAKMIDKEEEKSDPISQLLGRITDVNYCYRVNRATGTKLDRNGNPAEFYRYQISGEEYRKLTMRKDITATDEIEGKALEEYLSKYAQAGDRIQAYSKVVSENPRLRAFALSSSESSGS